MRRLYDIVAQSLGVAPSGQPYAGFRNVSGRDLSKADWQRVYDVICRFVARSHQWDLQAEYRAAVNRIIVSYRIAWDLGEDGQLHRLLPPVAQSQIEAAFRELSRPEFRSGAAIVPQSLWPPMTIDRSRDRGIRSATFLMLVEIGR